MSPSFELESDTVTASSLQTQQLWTQLQDIYDARALNPYGLSLINQRAHAVQSGHHARQQGLSDALITAALLHDIGHMVHQLGEHPAAQGIDDQHEAVGAHWLIQYFGPDVCEPVRLHVAAKRYLCAVEPSYRDGLSRDSIESLALQGGPMSVDEVSAFEREPYWQDAVALRRIDELAKDPNAPAWAFAEFRDVVMRACLTTSTD
jgi:phosphonate degradation associated HDIG domain protein